ncbi:hypothetical protein VSDG_07599 [Cytospora chrysosperma]|uniref:Uncharacterized protein n=1 Tax=Cytospora chrysosperma TaxID=252740 RepID=A0A423VLQ1_CYTCH|nr:hypothetical protein VSDG_07599 [Valsa sordida]
MIGGTELGHSKSKPWLVGVWFFKINRRVLVSHNRLNYETYKLQDVARPVQSLQEAAKTVLNGALFMDATLPVDHIYALYNMLVMCGLPLPEPDYNKAFEVVYEETVWAWIQEWQDLSILQTAARPTHIQNLPSWAKQKRNIPPGVSQ